MSISFSRVPAGASLLIPGFFVEFDASRAAWGAQPRRSLIIGQTLNAAFASPAWVESTDSADAAYGAASQLARMIRAFRRNEPNHHLYALPLPPAGGSVANTYTITLTGTATGAGALHLYLAGDYTPVAVARGATAAQLATAVADAVNANTTLVFTAAAVANVVTLTNRQAGAFTNTHRPHFNLRGARGGERLPAGIAVTFDSPFSGAGEASLASVAAALAEEPFDVIVLPSAAPPALDAADALLDDVTGRWAWNRQVFGMAFAGLTPFPDLASALAYTSARNGPRVTLMDVSSEILNPEYEWGAAYAGACAASLYRDPAQPVQDLPILGVWAPRLPERRTLAQQNQMLGSGLSTFTVDPDGQVRIQRAVTTYQRNAAGQTDRSLLDIETTFTLMEVTRRLRAVVLTKFARAKLASDGTRISPSAGLVVTPSVVRSELISHYGDLVTAGLVEDEAGFARDLIVRRNAENPNRLDVLYPPNLINQLRQTAVINQFRA